MMNTSNRERPPPEQVVCWDGKTDPAWDQLVMLCQCRAEIEMK